MKRLFSLLIFIIFYSINITPQVILDAENAEESKTLSRLKLSGGYFMGEYSEIGRNSPFINLNYRATELKKYVKGFEAGLSFEAGVNVIKGVFPVYAKAGPEAKITGNLILGLNAGFTGIFIYPIPFYGLNSFYLFNISDNIYLELESGFHSSFSEKKAPVFYLSVGLSVN
jgi:hypothetical protein